MASTPADDVAQVIDAELALLSPSVRRCPAEVEQLLDHEFREIGSSGRVWSRAELVAALAQEADNESAIGAVEMAGEIVGPDLVLLSYTSAGRGSRTRRTSLWRRSDGGWRLLHHQGTPLPDSQPAPSGSPSGDLLAVGDVGGEPRPTNGTINALDEVSFQAWYGRWSPLEPPAVAALFADSGVRWWIAGGRAARMGAPRRHHEDIDVAVRLLDLPQLRRHLAGWHLWEAHDGSLRPLPAGEQVRPDCEQLWLRRDAHHPWELDLLLDRSRDEWVFKRDARVRLPWHRALHTVGGVTYLRPEIALLHKAHLDRPKDRDDLAAAVLDSVGRAWLVETLRLLGHHDWVAAVASPPPG